MCMHMYMYRVYLGFSKGGAKPSGESLKQGFWGGGCAPEAIGCLVFEISKSIAVVNITMD